MRYLEVRRARRARPRPAEHEVEGTRCEPNHGQVAHVSRTDCYNLSQLCDLPSVADDRAWAGRPTDTLVMGAISVMASAPAAHRIDILDGISLLEAYQFATGLCASTHRVTNKYLVRCPAANHEDRNPSCSLNPDKRFWHCFACGAEGGVLDLIVASGSAIDRRNAVEWLRVARNKPRPEYRPQPKLGFDRESGSGHLVDEELRSIHDFVDEKGSLVSQVLRFEGLDADGRSDKRFLQRAPAGGGSWIYDMRHIRRVPYRLPKLREAASASRSVTVAEGELKADILATMGFASTSHAGGANWHWPISWAKHFEGTPLIFVLADSDEPGRKAARARKALLEKDSRKVVVVDFFPNRHDGSDIFDWLRERGHGDLIDRFLQTKKHGTPMAKSLTKAAAADLRKYLTARAKNEPQQIGFLTNAAQLGAADIKVLGCFR